MKKYAPYIFGVIGLILIATSILLRNGTPDADMAITNLASSFMVFAGAICLLIGLVTFFLRHDETDVW